MANYTHPSAYWTSTNPILELGDFGRETDTGQSKVGDGVTAWNDLTYQQMYLEFAVASGTDTYAVTYGEPNLLGYFTGLTLNVKFTNANTGASTLNVNGFGAKAIKKSVSTALSAADITAGGIYALVYDGTNFQIDISSGGGGGGGDVVGPASSTNNNFAIFDGATGKLLKDTGVDASDFDAAGAASAALASANAHSDALIIDSIADSDTTHAPSRNSVFDALALKAPLISPTFATSIIGSYLTASELLGTGASKEIVSLPVATYPSLTELTYVKGVTSAIQTQIGAKKAIATGNNYKFETTDASGNLQETTVTASRAVATDANGLPTASATTATELGYVNGVTSAIQTQINAKKTDSMTTARLLGRTTAGTGAIEEITVGSGLNLAAGVLNTTSGTNIVLNKTVTDVTVNATPETKVYSYTVPANTLAAGDILDLIARFRKTGTAGTMITRIRFGVNNSTADTIMATMTSAAATLTQNMERTWVIKDATHIEVYPPTSNVNTDIASSGTAITSVTVDLTVTNYIVITIQDASAVDTGIFSAFYVRKN